MTRPQAKRVTIELDANELNSLFVVTGKAAARDNSRQSRDALKVADRLSNAFNAKGEQQDLDL